MAEGTVTHNSSTSADPNPDSGTAFPSLPGSSVVQMTWPANSNGDTSTVGIMPAASCDGEHGFAVCPTSAADFCWGRHVSAQANERLRKEKRVSGRQSVTPDFVYIMTLSLPTSFDSFSSFFIIFHPHAPGLVLSPSPGAVVSSLGPFIVQVFYLHTSFSVLPAGPLHG